ncbi:helix-turn-helix domain-containing protein [bacterium]|nr:helix-turn-helix domain-containing protein [bacterium]
MVKKKYPKEFERLLASVKAKRPKTVIEHIRKHGHITTEELKNIYGYNHPPRAARDVREQGIPLDTFKVTSSDGRKIAAYRFGDPRKSRSSKLSGRTVLSKHIKEKLIEKYGCKCFIYLEKMDEHELQIDHRIPFELAGDKEFDETKIDAFMLLSSSANRAKSWSCEHCENWISLKKSEICSDCYWAFPENYNHIAMKQIRRVDILWQGQDIEQYEELKKQSLVLEKDIPQFIKEIVEKAIFNKK